MQLIFFKTFICTETCYILRVREKYTDEMVNTWLFIWLFLQSMKYISEIYFCLLLYLWKRYSLLGNKTTWDSCDKRCCVFIGVRTHDLWVQSNLYRVIWFVLKFSIVQSDFANIRKKISCRLVWFAVIVRPITCWGERERVRALSFESRFFSI